MQENVTGHYNDICNNQLSSNMEKSKTNFAIENQSLFVKRHVSFCGYFPGEKVYSYTISIFARYSKTIWFNFE